MKGLILMKNNVSDSELEILKVLWAADGALSIAEISERLSDVSWKYTTVSTLLTRMCEKGAVTAEKRGRTYYYTPLADENDYKLKSAKSFINKLYGGSVKNLVASLFENKELSDEDIAELKEMFKL